MSSDSSAPQQPLSFLHLWDSPDAIAEVEARSKRTNDALAAVFRDQCTFAASAAKLHHKQTQSPLGAGEMGSYQSFLFAFKGLSETHAANYEILANTVHEVARKPSESLKTYLETNHKRLSSESVRLHKELAELTSEVDKARHRCERVYREMESALTASQAAFEAVGARRPGASEEGAHRLRTRYQQLQKDLHAADLQYIAAVKAARTFRVDFDERNAQLLAAYQQIETTRQARTLKVAKQYLQAHESVLSSLLRNVRDTLAAIDEAQPERDLQAFIAQRATHAPPPPLPAYRSYTALATAAGANAPTGHIPIPIPAVTPDDEKSEEVRAAEVFFQRSIDSLFWSARKEANDDNTRRVSGGAVAASAAASSAPASPSSSSTPPVESTGGTDACVHPSVDTAPAVVAPASHPYELVSEVLNEMTALLRTPHGRTAFGTILNQFRALSTGLPARAFDTLEYLVKIFLDEAHDQHHTQPAKVVMIMSQTFFRRSTADATIAPSSADGSVPAAAQREYLHARVYHHAIFRDMRFWKESFFDSVRVELSKHEPAQRWHTDSEQAEINSRTKQCVFSHLAAISFNMKEFALDATERREFIESMSMFYDLDAGSLDMLLAIADAPMENH
jgi:hypothetical protein